MLPNYELHIAGPRIKRPLATQVFTELTKIGLDKNKFFHQLYDVPPNPHFPYAEDTPSIGHDLTDPGFMSSVKSEDYQRIKDLAIKGMQILRDHSLPGIFEIERVITPDSEQPKRDIITDFPGFRRVPNNPLYENHLVWKGAEASLPQNDQIISAIQEILGINPHQIVDFSQNFFVGGSTIVTRVATIYQATANNATTLLERMKQNQATLKHKYAIAEQVCLVAEYDH